MNRLLPVLLLLSSPAYACDWYVMSDKIDPMTDDRVCTIRSPAANLALSVRAGRVTFATGSAYGPRDGLSVRVDDYPQILLGERSRSTDAHGDNARMALHQIVSGSRLRVSYLDYPNNKTGDAPICTLPALLASCAQ